MIEIVDSRSNGEILREKLKSRNRIEHRDVTRLVNEIVDNVRKNGDRAVIEYTGMYDRVGLTPDGLKVSPQEIEDSYSKVDRKLVDVIRKAKRNIEDFHSKQMEKSWFHPTADGVILGQVCRALSSVGVYVPGGTAALTSSVLMNIVPAKVAGVDRVVMVTPPRSDGGTNPAMLVAANEAGANEIYRVGGAQAVAALAFGTDTIPKVDKIIGPGNIYVSTAKRMVYGYCDIDMFAGPSEIAVIADETANPVFVAADLLSQAEHDVMSSSILITTCAGLAERVRDEIARQCSYLERKDIIEKSLKDFGIIIIVNNAAEAAGIVNAIAPEHLELCVNEPFNLLGGIKNAGAVFLGHYSSEPLGDYLAGPDHVLPTGGTARFFSPLCVNDFIKKSNIISYTEDALRCVKDDIILFAESEGLSAHANAIKVRFEK